MLGLLLDRAREVSPAKTLVVAGHQIDRVREVVGSKTQVVWQKELLGSGHAVAQTAKKLAPFKGRILLLYCDTPLISSATIRRLLKVHEETKAQATLLSVVLEHPVGYGRILKNLNGHVERIVEEADADEEEKKIREINVGCYVFDTKKLFEALRAVRKNPKKKEYYLTDVIEILARVGIVASVPVQDPGEVAGINTRHDLATMEARMQQDLLKQWVERGVRIRDPRTTTLDADVLIGEDTVIYPNTVIEEGSVIGKGCHVGPFARIRGRSKIGDGCVIGNFVEIVRSTIGSGSQIKHLSYIGDAEIGTCVNVGAGTITANFDGKKKHKTVIKDKAQIGSGTILVAPVTVGRSAKTGAGAVVTRGKNVPDRGVVIGVPARALKVKGRP